MVEKEDSVFPMVPAGADLDKMIRRPKQDVMLESGSDKDWEMPAAPVAVVRNGDTKAAQKPNRAAAHKGAKVGKRRASSRA